MVRALLEGPECRAVSRIYLVGLDRRRRNVETAISGTDGRSVVLSAIVFGCCVAAIWRAAGVSRGLLRPLLGVAALALSIAVFVTVTVAGRFGDRITDLAGGWTSLTRAQAALSAVTRSSSRRRRSAITSTSGPVSVFIWPPTFATAYPETERLLVFWFEPEIYYYGDRLMAQRHLVFPPAWANWRTNRR